MSRTLLWIVLLCPVLALAQDRAALTAEADRLSEAISARVRALQQSERAKELEQAAEQARADCEAAERALPGVAALDAEIDRLLASIHALREQRNAILREHGAELEAKRRTADAAQEAHAAVVLGDAEVQALIAQRQALARTQEAAPAAALPVAEQ